MPPTKPKKPQHLRPGKRSYLELIDTELQFLTDMKLLKQEYAIPAEGVLSPFDCSLLFGSLDPIITLSSDLLRMCKTEPLVGIQFLQLTTTINSVYTDYCKFNNEAMLKIQEYSSSGSMQIRNYLQVAQSKIQGKTGAWDLGSLLVKPVQRVLKYPLLLKALIKETDPTDPDYENLCLALSHMEAVAENINQVKKRKDIVEKYAEKGPRNALHGLNKKLHRASQIFKKNIGLTQHSLEVSSYQELAQVFENRREYTAKLIKDVQAWIKLLKEQFESELAFAKSLKETFTLKNEDYTYRDTIALVAQYELACERLLSGPWKNADSRIKLTIIPLLEKLLIEFKQPMVIMKKRQDKLLDLERLEQLNPNEPVEKGLQESAEAFEPIHAQLLEELPVFLKLVSQFIHLQTGGILEIQTSMLSTVLQYLSPVAEALRVDGHMTLHDIPLHFFDAMSIGNSAERLTSKISLLQAWHDKVWADGAYQLYQAEATQNHNEESLIDTNRVGKTAPIPIMSIQAITAMQNKIAPLEPIKLDEIAKSEFAVEEFNAKSIYPFRAEYENELGFPENVTIKVSFVEGRNDCEGWWYGTWNGASGWFPGSHVVPI